jgi:NifU-like protein involved in Fe-S cluster formation
LFGSASHGGRLADRPGVRRGRAGQRRNGTEVEFALRFQGSRIAEARYLAYGCPYTLAACEWLATQLEGRELANGLLGSPEDWIRELGAPIQRLGRLFVVEDALKRALEAVEWRPI